MADETRTRLLIVDDEKPIRHLLARIATRAGFECDLAKDGLDALEMLATREYTIVLVDLMMPRLSGYELVQRISGMTPRPTVIVTTALTNGDIATLDDSMVRRVIKKPFDIRGVAQALIETAQQIREQPTATEPPAMPGTDVIPGDVVQPPSPKKPAR